MAYRPFRRPIALLVVACLFRFGLAVAHADEVPPPVAPAAVPPPAEAPPPPPLSPPPPLVRYELKPHWALFIAGTASFGAIWILTSLGAYLLEDGYAAIPLVGPLFYVESADTNTQRSIDVGLILVSLAQLATVGLAVAGLLWKHKVAVPDLALAPMATPGGGGLAAAFRF